MRNISNFSLEFQIYNLRHDICVSVNVNDIIAKSCDINDVNQRWVWTNKKQLRNVKSGTCLEVNGDVKKLTRLRVFACNYLSPSQLWECSQDLVHVSGSNLNMNYGNEDKPHVLLYTGTGTFSQWKIFGTSTSICDRKP